LIAIVHISEPPINVYIRLKAFLLLAVTLTLRDRKVKSIFEKFFSTGKTGKALPGIEPGFVGSIQRAVSW